MDPVEWIKMLISGLGYVALFFLATFIAGWFGITLTWSAFIANLANWMYWVAIVVTALGVPMIGGWFAKLIDGLF